MGRRLPKESNDIVVGPTVTTEAAARLFGVSRVSVHRWLVTGAMQCSTTPGGHRRITREELARYARISGRPVPPQLLEWEEEEARVRVLVVDDDKTLVRSLRRMLDAGAPKRFGVTAAEDGFTALLTVAQSPPDVIFLDGILRGMDGVQACRSLKRNPKTRHILVIAISGKAALKKEFLKAGADAFLLKPFDADDVLGQLEALKVARTRRSAA